MKFYVNTDSVDIRNKQIGIHFEGTKNREFCAGVNHNGTKESVEKATKIANLLAASPKLLAALKVFVSIERLTDDGPWNDADVDFALEAAREAIKKVEGV